MPEESRPKMPNLEALRYFRSTAILALVATLLIAVTLLTSIRVGEIGPTDIGVKINNYTGNIEVIDRAGKQIYLGVLSNFYVLDKRIQKLEMVADPNRGDRRERDDLRIKTVDGSNVNLDLTVTYKMLLDPENVRRLVADSGLGDAYKVKWVRDYARSVCRAIIGELTTEEFYDVTKLSEKQDAALTELNRRLEPHGLGIQGVIVENFVFHDQYQQRIDEKNLADQETEKQVSEASAALEQQKVREMQARKQMDVEVATFDGKLRQLLVETNAQASRAVLEAEAYAIDTRLSADARFIEMEKNAQAIQASKDAEAQATAQMARAMEGDGGQNLVKLEYAGRLKSMLLTGQPFSVSGRTERFSHTEEGAAAPVARPADGKAKTEE